MPDGYVLDKPLSLSCPDCGGVLRPDNRAGIRQFRCHIGHVLTAETTLVAQFTVLEKKLAGSLALLNERAELCQQMGEDARKDGDGTSLFEAAAREAPSLFPARGDGAFDHLSMLVHPIQAVLHRKQHRLCELGVVAVVRHAVDQAA